MSEVPTTSKMVEEEAKKAPNVPEQITPKIDFSSRETFLRMDVFLKYGFKVDRVTFRALEYVRRTQPNAQPFGLFYPNDNNAAPFLVKIFDYSHDKSLLKIADNFDVDATKKLPQNNGEFEFQVVAKFKEYYDIHDGLVKFVNLPPHFNMREWGPQTMIFINNRRLQALKNAENKPAMVTPILVKLPLNKPTLKYDAPTFDADSSDEAGSLSLSTPKRARHAIEETEEAVSMIPID